ncbi:hypothetical protein [Paenibacillus lentus]|uniref:Tat pathway signal sequence domain protein n=1 Tax=Paenibacillus lentus TaxID=1338368 RepID=A0A3Q8S4J1_9BACL|nr:hypothetical protein [Paenibacillus lentus]AZK46355.1 hypothetical protein EIM92_09335 [Paenibacillus lentus]
MALRTSVGLRWLNQPSIPVGVTWGIPWAKGVLGREGLSELSLISGDSESNFQLLCREFGKSAGGEGNKQAENARIVQNAVNAENVVNAGCATNSASAAISKNAGSASKFPLQSWATAYWPDGSVKWTAHATVASSEEDQAERGTAVVVRETKETVIVDTGVIVCTINKQGRGIIRSIVQTGSGSMVCSSGELVCIREETSSGSGLRTMKEEKFIGSTLRVKVEQQGPVRAVVRLDGRHQSIAGGKRQWLPFTLRLYFYAGLSSIRMVHTFFYDGNPHHDFVRGLGISFTVPLQGALYNRHVGFAGDRGLFSESPKTLHTRRTKGRYRELYAAQIEGRTVQFESDQDAYFLGLLDDSASWDSYKLVQESSEHYRIFKRTTEGCSWVKVTDGKRARGLGYVGGEGGGLAAGLKDFWQKAPSGMEIHAATENEAEFVVWFWSPDAPAMDLRHYDTKTHVESAYEGAEEMRATPYGIANTSELMIWCMEETPGLEQLGRMAAEAAAPARLVCDPAYYHEAGAFGIWSLPDRSTPAKAYLEDRLDGIIAFYKAEVEQRKWYGFWDYGDYMHSYDPIRHVWNYDLGGCAWQNTELVPNMWLWLMFLRSGRADVFRMAEAMTRHTSEVDVYHFGEYAGLGSRHNVMHWGCGCKEARIAMAGLHRYYYYLTADERIGDILDEVKDADYSTVTLDPMRAYFPKDEHPTHIRVGPDWAAFSSNWMTRWERFEDTSYRDKILRGINSIKAANFRLISGPTYGYDPKTGILTGMGDDNWGRHLAICMGGPQIWFELAGLLEDPEWEDMLAEFGVFYNLSDEKKLALTGGAIGGNKQRFEHPVLSVAIAAYGAYYRQDAEVAAQCWAILLENNFARVNLQEAAVPVIHLDELLEIEWMNTNEASQWSINTIISLELIADVLPPQIPGQEQEQKEEGDNRE